jgi:hypothetical protein
MGSMMLPRVRSKASLQPITSTAINLCAEKLLLTCRKLYKSGWTTFKTNVQQQSDQGTTMQSEHLTVHMVYTLPTPLPVAFAKGCGTI